MPTELRLRAAEAVALFALVGTLLVFFGPLFAPLGLTGLALAQLALIGAPPLVWARARGRAPLARLGVVAPRLRPLAGALMIGLGFWYLNLVIAVPLAERIAGSSRELERLTEELLAGPEPFALRLTAVALVPALCEELLLRGAVAGGLRPALGARGAIVVSALLFAALHMSLVRLLPTALFGVVLGYAALAGGSTVLSMIIHAVNNGIAVFLATPAGTGLARPLEDHPWPAAAAALALTAIGLVLVGKPPRAEMPSS
jgi:membrane protease YdiL (CAAX protease family)